MTEARMLHPFCRVYFLKDGSRVNEDEAWDTCTVTPLGLYTYAEMKFDNTPHGISLRDKLLAFLQISYDLGKSAAKREIRDVLGIKDSWGL